MSIDETHAPQLKSWVPSANAPGCDFPVQNLPFGRFRRSKSDGWQIGVAIGDQILDLRQARRAGCSLPSILDEDTLAPFIAAGPLQWKLARLALSRALRADAPLKNALVAALLPQSDAEMGLPCDIPNYTDFFTGVHHAVNAHRVGNRELPENYHWVPIAYHGRASSVMPSGAAIRRPNGQAVDFEGKPKFGPTARMDFELELGVFVQGGNSLGDAIPIGSAEENWFGIVLLNDWSARDIQAWESLPLGPFLSKNYATTLSPWVVTRDALEPFRCALQQRTGTDPKPLEYLEEGKCALRSGVKIRMEAAIQTPSMSEPFRLMASQFDEVSYWSFAQMIAHHTSNGCNLQPGDLLGTGTQSGPRFEDGGCLLELSQAGSYPVVLPTGEARTFLQDGDTVVLSARCEKAGAISIGFGECIGTVIPASQAI